MNRPLLYAAIYVGAVLAFVVFAHFYLPAVERVLMPRAW